MFYNQRETLEGLETEKHNIRCALDPSLWWQWWAQGWKQAAHKPTTLCEPEVNESDELTHLTREVSVGREKSMIL